MKKKILHQVCLCRRKRLMLLLIPCLLGVSSSAFQPTSRRPSFLCSRGKQNIRTSDEQYMRGGRESHCNNHHHHHHHHNHYDSSILQMVILFPKTATRRRFSRLVLGVGNNAETTEEQDNKPAAAAAAAADFSNFNPFDYKSTHSNSAYSYSGTQISLRKTQMQELVTDLLNVVQGDSSSSSSNSSNSSNRAVMMQEMLNSSKDMLLEPLEDVANAVLDPDSIYAPNMTRIERYRAYRVSMEERINKARNPQVRLVLQELKDFVLSFE